MVSLGTLNAAASILHLAQAIAVVCLIGRINDSHQDEPPLFKGVYSIMKNLFLVRAPGGEGKCGLAPYRNETSSAGGARFDATAVVVPHAFDVGFIDVRYLIFAFFALSSLFQGVEALAGDYRGPRILRFIEYAFSASVMILAMAVQVGLTDIYLLTCMFILMFTTNLLGLIAEVLCFVVENNRVPFLSIWFWLVPHGLGWLTYFVAYAPLIDAYIVSTRCSDRSPPGFVNVIIFLEFALFSSFGFVQLYALLRRSFLFAQQQQQGYYLAVPPGFVSPAEHITHQADLAYIGLSFVAKTLLAWLVLAPTLTS
jgi:hypothetical protein